MANDVVDHGRRKFLTATTVVVGGAGALAAAVPFIKSWEPSARAKNAGAPVMAAGGNNAYGFNAADIRGFPTGAVSLTGGGAVGRLWSCGDAGRLSAALLSITSQPRAALRSEVRAHFDHALSFDAVGRKLGETYEHLWNRDSSLSGAERLPRADSRPTPA